MKAEMLKPITLAALVAMAAPAFAQDDSATDGATDSTADTTTEAPATDAPAADAAATDAPATDAPAADAPAADGAADTPAAEAPAEPEATGERQPGQTYVAEVIGDWEIQCAHNPNGDDPCQLYQLLKDDTGSPVSEISFQRLPDGGQALAGATVLAPLETLLQQQLSIVIDGGTPRRYGFRFCAQIGCVAQMGFTAAEVGAFKAGNQAVMTIVPVRAPDQKVQLPISLTGFTKAFDSLAVPVAPQQ